jgi:Acetyltransferase (GNAT) domain
MGLAPRVLSTGIWSGTRRAQNWRRYIFLRWQWVGPTPAMSVQILSAPLESYQQDLITLFRRYLTPDSNENRFNWLYKQCPYGRALAWVASDTENGAIVGAAAAFPRKFYFQGAEKTGWVLGDFCLAEQYRSMGPALQLQRACLQVASPPHDFCYDFPSKPMMSIYRRMGVQQASNLVRWAKPLRVEDKLRRIVRSENIARALGKIGSSVLNARGWKGTGDACNIEQHQGPCGDEFTVLDESFEKIPALRPVRTAAYLNWRYLEHPRGAHLILVARKKGTLMGYVVVRNEQENARIVDLASVEEPAVIARLIDAAVRVVSVGGAKTVHLAVGESHPWSAIFRRAGFRRRESSPIVVVSQPGAISRGTDFKTRCYLMEGERDS